LSFGHKFYDRVVKEGNEEAINTISRVTFLTLKRRALSSCSGWTVSIKSSCNFPRLSNTLLPTSRSLPLNLLFSNASVSDGSPLRLFWLVWRVHSKYGARAWYALYSFCWATNAFLAEEPYTMISFWTLLRPYQDLKNPVS